MFKPLVVCLQVMVTRQTAIIVFIIARCGILEFEAKRSRLVGGSLNKRGTNVDDRRSSHQIRSTELAKSLPSTCPVMFLTTTFLRSSSLHGYLYRVGSRYCKRNECSKRLGTDEYLPALT